MSGRWHPSGRATVSQTNPRALGVCDKCGFLYNHNQLRWQYQWAGILLQNQRRLVCEPCHDIPQEQLRTVILPPDPVPIFNPRPEAYDTEVPSFMSTESGDNLVAESGDNLTQEIRVTPRPDYPYYIFEEE